MTSTQKLNRKILSLCLVLALGITPGLTVFAQQSAQTKVVPKQAQTSEKMGQKAKSEKQGETEDVLLSEAEMENVKGGIAWFVPIAIGAAIAGGSAYLSHRSHQKILKACSVSRR
jgi:hypothetical protein